MTARVVATVLAAMFLSPAAASAVTLGAPQMIPGSGNARPAAAIAVDADGHAIAVMIINSASGTQIGIAARPPRGSWGAPQTFAAGPGAQGLGADDAPVAAINDDGAAVAMWRGSSGLMTLARSGRDQPWEGPQEVGAPSEVDARVAVDPEGDAVVVYSTATSTSPFLERVRSHTRAAGGSWSGPLTLEEAAAADASFHVYDLDFSPDEILHLLYADLQNADLHHETKPQGFHVWNEHGTPDTLAGHNLGGLGSEGRLRARADGSLLAVWSEHSNDDRHVQVATRPAGSLSWPMIGVSIWDEVTSSGSPVTDIELEVSVAGSALVTFSLPTAQVRAARRPPGGPYGPAELLEENAHSPVGAVSAAGAMAAAWTSNTPVVGTLWSGTDDTAAAWSEADRLSPTAVGRPFAASGGALMLGFGAFGAAPGLYTRTNDTAATPTPTPTPTATPAPTPAPSPPAPSPIPPAPGGGTTSAAAKFTSAKARCRRARARKPCRVTITFGVDRAVTVKVTVRRRLGAKKRKVGSLRRAVKPPRATIALPDRLGGRKLGRGRYEIVIAAPGGKPVVLKVRVR